MKKFTLQSILSIISFSVCFGQRSELALIPFEVNGKWGYMNHEKKVVIEPKFEEAHPTFDTKGLIKLNGKYGYIDYSTCNIAIKPQYLSATDFMYGRAVVKKRKRTYTIDTNGEKPKFGVALCGSIYYNSISPDEEPRYVFQKDDKYGFVFQKMLEVNDRIVHVPDTIPPIYDAITSIGLQLWYIVKNDKIAFFYDAYFNRFLNDKAGYLKFEYDEIKLFQTFENDPNYLEETIGVKKDGKWGYVKFSSGHGLYAIVEPKYFSIQKFRSDLALVEYESGKFGYIDSAGKEYFKPDP